MKVVPASDTAHITLTVLFCCFVFCCPRHIHILQRRTASSYMIWMNAEGRAQAKARFPDAKVTEVARYCGETWHSMSAEDKVRVKT